MESRKESRITDIAIYGFSLRKSLKILTMLGVASSAIAAYTLFGALLWPVKLAVEILWWTITSPFAFFGGVVKLGIVAGVAYAAWNYFTRGKRA